MKRRMRKNPSLSTWLWLGAGAVVAGIAFLVWRGRASAQALPGPEGEPSPEIPLPGEAVPGSASQDPSIVAYTESGEPVRDPTIVGRDARGAPIRHGVRKVVLTHTTATAPAPPRTKSTPQSSWYVIPRSTKTVSKTRTASITSSTSVKGVGSYYRVRI